MNIIFSSFFFLTFLSFDFLTHFLTTIPILNHHITQSHFANSTCDLFPSLTAFLKLWPWSWPCDHELFYKIDCDIFFKPDNNLSLCRYDHDPSVVIILVLVFYCPVISKAMMVSFPFFATIVVFDILTMKYFQIITTVLIGIFPVCFHITETKGD